MNLENFAVTILVGVVYAFIGWKASKEKFNLGKFLATIAIQTVQALGLGLSGLNIDVYTSAVAPTTITVFVQKIWNILSKKPDETVTP